MSKVLEIKQLNIKGIFKNEEKAIVSDLSFTAEKGEKIAIVGESGCGKTMTANSIFGLLPKNCIPCGEIILNGKDILKMKKTEIEALRGVEIVMIPSGAEFLNPVLKVQTQMFES
ncbi:MAG: ATP-binding cassette domain-containing protein, partial [Clostridia bacterium]